MAIHPETAVGVQYNLSKIFAQDTDNVSYEIQKVFRCDETVNHSILNSGYSLIDNFQNHTVTNWELNGRPPYGGFNLTKSGSSLTLHIKPGKQTIALTPAINLSPYKSMKIMVSRQTLSSTKGVRFGFCYRNDMGGDNRAHWVDIYNPGEYTMNFNWDSSYTFFCIRPVNDTPDEGTLTITELTLEEK